MRWCKHNRQWWLYFMLYWPWLWMHNLWKSLHPHLRGRHFSWFWRLWWLFSNPRICSRVWTRMLKWSFTRFSLLRRIKYLKNWLLSFLSKRDIRALVWRDLRWWQSRSRWRVLSRLPSWNRLWLYRFTKYLLWSLWRFQSSWTRKLWRRKQYRP